MPLANQQRIIVTSPDGTRRRRLPTDQIVSADCRLARWGGMDSFTVNTAVPYRGDALPTILLGDRVEMYYKGVLRFRGWIEERLRTEGEPDTLTFTGYGLSFLIGQQLCLGRYAYAGAGVDIGSAFAEIIRDATVSRNQTMPSATGRQGMNLYDALKVDRTGTTTTFVDAYGKLLKDVLNDLLQNQAGNLATWGGDVDAYGQNRLYCRTLAPTTFPPTHTVIVPSRQTIAAEGEVQGGDLKNRTLITGGQPRFPELLHNGGFDLPAVFQTGDSGLITDGDFENLSWTLSGGASYKDGGHQEGQPFSGSVMVEMDNAGESVQKSSTFATAPVAGHSYVFSARAKKEVGLQTADGSGYLQVKNSAGTVLLTVPLTVAPAGTAWDYFSATFSMPASANKWTAHFQADHVSSYLGDTGGLLIDAVSLEDGSVVYQDGWQTHVYGTAQFNAINWAYKDVVYDGLYCVYLNVTAADSDNHDAHLEPLNRATVPLAFKQTVRFGLRYRSPLVPTAGLGIPKFRLVLDWFRSDGSYISHSIVTVNAQAANSTWQYAEIVGTPPSDAASCCPVFNPRGSGEVLVDCLSVQDAEAVAAGDVPAAPDGHPGFQPEGSLIAVQTASGITTLNLTGGTIVADANPGTADLTITVSSDHKVLADAGDPAADYLAAKFESSATLSWSQDVSTHALIGTVPKGTSTAFGVVMTDMTSGTPIVYLKSSVDTLLAGKEASLGSPPVSGYLLSSTAAGVRSWVSPAAGGAGVEIDVNPYGTVTGAAAVLIVLDGDSLDGGGVHQTGLGAAGGGPYVTARVLNAMTVHSVQVSPASGDTLYNPVTQLSPASLTLTPGQWADFYSNGTSVWFVLPN